MKRKTYRTPVNSLTATDAAYFAGIIDGEGCFTATVSKGSVRGCLEIGSVHKSFTEQLQAMIGVGNIRVQNRRRKNARPLHVLSISLGSLKSLLVQVESYLRLKKQQAKMIGALCDYEFPSRYTDAGQTEAIVCLSRLNRRGVTPELAMN